MPRTLPWRVDEERKKSTKQPTKSTAAERTSDLTDDVVDADLNNLTSSSHTKKRTATVRSARSPSTSPPPAPPEVEFMLSGFDADDQWMMVEDEFTSIAQQFTQHIHHAEYVRLKKLARSRGRETLEDLTRPTDGRTALSQSGKLRREKNELDRRVERAMKKGMDDDSDEEDADSEAWRFEPALAGLMTTGGSQKGKQLVGIGKLRVNTRAAAGYDQSPHIRAEKHDRSASRFDISFSEDELVTKSRLGRETLDQSSSPVYPLNRGAKKEDEPARHQSFFKRFSGSSPDASKAARTTDMLKSPAAELDKDGAFRRSAQSTAASEFLAKRKAAREKREQQAMKETIIKQEGEDVTPKKKKKSSGIEVPTWI